MSLIILILLAVAALAVMWLVGIFNSLVSSKATVNEAWSGIDVQLKRRYDLIPNLVALVKQYSTHEKNVFEKVAQLRSASMNATGVEQKSQAEAGLTQALKTLFAVAESYPELKANENYLSLQKELSSIEQEIQLSRRYYNGATRDYNILTQRFPSNIVSGMFGYSPVPYFELDNPAERQAPRIE